MEKKTLPLPEKVRKPLRDQSRVGTLTSLVRLREGLNRRLLVDTEHHPSWGGFMYGPMTSTTLASKSGSLEVR